MAGHSGVRHRTPRVLEGAAMDRAERRRQEKAPRPSEATTHKEFIALNGKRWRFRKLCPGDSGKFVRFGMRLNGLGVKRPV